jgi:hypothetical protein
MNPTIVPETEERPARYIKLSFGDGASRNGEAAPFQPVEDRRSKDRGAADQRASPRRRVLLSALVVKSDFSGMFRCGVHDVSDNGARLKIPTGILLPADFWLIATSAGLAYEAKTVWRGYPNVGVSVGEPIDLQDPATRAARKLRTLWMSVTT